MRDDHEDIFSGVCAACISRVLRYLGSPPVTQQTHTKASPLQPTVDIIIKEEEDKLDDDEDVFLTQPPTKKQRTANCLQHTHVPATETKLQQDVESTSTPTPPSCGMQPDFSWLEAAQSASQTKRKNSKPVTHCGDIVTQDYKAMEDKDSTGSHNVKEIDSDALSPTVHKNELDQKPIELYTANVSKTETGVHVSGVVNVSPDSQQKFLFEHPSATICHCVPC